MTEHTDCQGCICYGRGYALAVTLCAALRREGLCQKQVTLRLAGVEIEGEWRANEQPGD